MQGGRTRALALLGVVVSLALTGCAAAATGSTARALVDAPLGPAPTVRLGADEVTLLRSGQASFDRIGAVIGGAHAVIHLEMYELANHALVRSLLAATMRGVQVTVIADPSESSSHKADMRLRAQGVTVLDYPVRKQMIDHVKLLVVDGAVAIVGGMNWGAASPRNHDFDVLVRGPVVHNLDRVFTRDVMTAGHQVPIPGPLRDDALIVAATLPAAEIRPLVLDVLTGAQHTLDLEMYNLTDTGVVRALAAAHDQGVQVHVVLDPSQTSNLPSLDALRTAGVDVRMYRSRGELLHAKAVVADGTTVLFGSANWTGGGFVRNHEVDLELPDAPAVAAQMLEQMRLDWAAAA